MTMPRRMAADAINIVASTSSERRADELDQPARQPRPGDLGARHRERILRVRLDQPLACHDLRQHDLRGCTRDRRDRAEQEAAGVHPAHREPAHPPCERHARDDEGEQRFAGDVDRQLAHTVEPHANRQREQHEGRDLHRREQAHLRRARVQQDCSGEWQREHRDLPTERADQDRAPEPPIGRVAQQVVGRQAKAASPATPQIHQHLFHGPYLFLLHFARASGGCPDGSVDPVQRKEGAVYPILPLTSQRKLLGQKRMPR